MTTIDNLCQKITKPNVLNAFHACRPGHPLNNMWQWRDAYALASQNHRYFDATDLEWLRWQADGERLAASVS